MDRLDKNCFIYSIAKEVQAKVLQIEVWSENVRFYSVADPKKDHWVTKSQKKSLVDDVGLEINFMSCERNINVWNVDVGQDETFLL